MDPIHCFIKAYLIKVRILMFFYDAPEIWLSRICKPKSHPLGSSKPSCTVCAAIQAVLSGLPEEMDRHGHCEPNENQPEGNLSVMLFHQA